MIPTAIARWHAVVASKDQDALDSLLAEDVVFHSPVVHSLQVGKSITTKYLTAAMAVFFNKSFRFTRFPLLRLRSYFKVNDVRIAADPGMVSEATIAQIKQRQWKYILAVSCIIDAPP